MTQQYYSLPLTPAGMMRQNEHPKCSLAQSVASHLRLIMTTAFGELSSDENFGCSIWEYDFDNLTTGHKIKELIRESLYDAIGQYEKRLDGVRVDLLVRQEEIAHEVFGYRIKKKLSVTVTGVLRATNEKFTYEDSFYTGPLSHDLI
jgi:phage baseplate assembly protein W